MNALEDFLNLLDSWLGSAQYFPLALLGVGLFFTLYLGLPQIRYFAQGWRILFGREGRLDSEGATGDTTHFQALSTALSGTVGTGNIGGVAFAIFLGGPAALFWMWMTALIGMTTKFAEVTISHRYRRVDSEGYIVGGPMHYMEHGLGMKWLAVFFAIATVISSFGTGSLPQSNNMAVALNTSFGIANWLSGAVFAILMALVILGGIKRIARVAAAVVPLMGLLYAVGAFAVIAANIDQLVPSFVAVFRDAFTGSAAAGGFLGASFAYAFNRGVNRGLYSNEAGQGSAPIAHASARTKEPVSEGMVAILEPFIDTLVICTLTGMVILCSGVWTEKYSTTFAYSDLKVVAGTYGDEAPEDVAALYANLSGGADGAESFTGDLEVVEGAVRAPVTVLHNRSVAEEVRITLDGRAYTGTLPFVDGSLTDAAPEVTLTGRSLLHSVPLTIAAFQRGYLGVWGEYLVSIGLMFFAFSTALAWSYYGDRAVTYLLGSSWVLPYRLSYVVGFFTATIVDTSLIWLISSITIALMTLPNLFGLLMMRREIKSLISDYWERHHQAAARRR
ncbi:MAG: sodium:alanine symporter family protein [Pseudomonadota bacterium]